MRQLQSTQTSISIWILLALSTSHREALIRALSQILVETSTSPEGLIHVLTVDRAICIVFSVDDLPSGGFDHTPPLYIFIGCFRHRVPSILLDNGSTLNVCSLGITVIFDFGLSNFEPSS